MRDPCRRVPARPTLGPMASHRPAPRPTRSCTQEGNVHCHRPCTSHARRPLLSTGHWTPGGGAKSKRGAKLPVPHPPQAAPAGKPRDAWPGPSPTSWQEGHQGMPAANVSTWPCLNGGLLTAVDSSPPDTSGCGNGGLGALGTPCLTSSRRLRPPPPALALGAQAAALTLGHLASGLTLPCGSSLPCLPSVPCSLSIFWHRNARVISRLLCLMHTVLPLSSF